MRPATGQLARTLTRFAWPLVLVAAQGVGACGDDKTPATQPGSAGTSATAGKRGVAGRPNDTAAGQAGDVEVSSGGAQSSVGGMHGGGKPSGHGGSRPSGGGSDTGGSASGEPAGSAGESAGEGGEMVVGSGGTGPGGAGPSGGIGGTGPSGGVGGTGPNGGAGGMAGAGCGGPAILAHATEAWALAVDDGYVYFTSNTLDGSVQRVPVDGGPPELLLDGELFPHALAVSHGHLFWAALGPQPGHLYEATVTGADRTELLTDPAANATAPEVTPGFTFVAADENSVYYTSNLNVLSALPLAAGSSALELSGGPFNSTIVDVALYGSNLYWTNNGVGLFNAPQPGTAGVLRSDVSGLTDKVSLVSQLDFPQFAIAVDAESVFWNDDTAIYRTPHAGGSATPVVSLPAAPVGESSVVALASDGEQLYYSDGKAVYRVPVNGGTPTLMLDAGAEIQQLVVSGANLFFTDAKRDEVVKLPTCAVAEASTSAGGAGGQGGNGAAGLANAGGQSGTGTLATGGQGGVAAQGGSGGVAGSAGYVSCGGQGGLSAHGCPAPVAVASAPHPYGLARDNEYLYFSDYEASGGGVFRVALSGGAPEPLASGQTKVYDIAVDEQNVYFCLNDSSAGHLASVPKTGGTIVPLATGVASGLARVASDGVFVYYTTGYNSIYRLYAAGGHPGLITAGPYGSVVKDIAVDGTDVYWVNNGVFSDGTFTTITPGTAHVAKAPVSSPPDVGRHTLTAGLSAPLLRIALDATNVYFVDATSVYRQKKSGGSAVIVGAIAPATSGDIRDMLSDGEHVYFADGRGVYRLPVAGGATETLTSGFGNIESIVVDDTSLYFTDYSSGVVMKRPK